MDLAKNLIGKRSLHATGAETSNFDSLDASSELDNHCGGITQLAATNLLLEQVNEVTKS